MNAMRLVLASLAALTLAALGVPAPVAANPCASGCAEVTVEPCVGAFATGSSTLSTTWTLTYRHPTGTITRTSTGFTPPTSATGGSCWTNSCYYGTLTNDLGFYDSEGVCLHDG